MFSQKRFKSSRDVLQGNPVSAVASTEVQRWLLRLGGKGKRSVIIDNVLIRLREIRPSYWYSAKARGRIMRYLQLRQSPKPEEVEDLRIAYARFVPDQIEANVADNQELAEDFKGFVAMAIQSDPHVYGARVAAARELVGTLRDLVRVESR